MKKLIAIALLLTTTSLCVQILAKILKQIEALDWMTKDNNQHAPEDQQWVQSERLIHSLELTVRHEAFLQLARDPHIVSCLISLIGSDIQLQHFKLAAQPI